MTENSRLKCHREYAKRKGRGDDEYSLLLYSHEHDNMRTWEIRNVIEIPLTDTWSRFAV